ncbi:hypothetical protein AO726_11350 [Pseudomonas sp. TTU2014-080ASC]|nr:hypothetical protein [Pseudomonas sp. TTU2014-080ASC]KRW59407.1 hypothetical protein AO726_11350 [Pseudomonas sp. TTU2014-080ASC]
MESIRDRARTLIDKAGFERLIRETQIGLVRWQTVRYKSIRMSTEEIEELLKLFPQYTMWLAGGQIAPEIGQTSPDYDEANPKASE